jgi:pimeloyl-ACP methyl ester carboxylesterase
MKTKLIHVLDQILPTWTPSIKGEQSISELRRVSINGTELAIMIRGHDRNNPAVLFVHGGPCCSEIPYVRKYQKQLERDFAIIHYDQRGSGKSYEFGADYSQLTAAAHVSDLIALSEYVKDYLGKEQLLLVGHSYGTYLAAMAASQRPDLYGAYIGIGQMADTCESEIITLKKCIAAAEQAKNEKDIEALKKLEPSVSKSEAILPRTYVRKYGFAARNMNEAADYRAGFLFNPEYNLADVIRFHTASTKYQSPLAMEALQNPISGLVTKLDLPVWFVMGKYDGMTAPEAAERYLCHLSGVGTKEFLLFENSAHYPHFEENDRFCRWMKATFGS